MIKGFKKFKFNNVKYLNQARFLLLNKLRKLLKNKKVTFSNYHNFVDDKQHQKIQWELASYFRNKKIHILSFEGIRGFLYNYFGQSVLIQKKPFLRIARPFKTEDNIGLHKDTIYGQNPYEMSIHVPLISLGNKSCLKFAENSHLIDDKKIKFVKSQNLVTKGSKQHKLGKPYDPKKIVSKKYKEKSIPLRYGEFVFFSPAIIHGQEINLDKNLTRFSFDVRVSSKFFPVDFNLKKHNGSYIEFSKSPIENLAKKYISKQSK